MKSNSYADFLIGNTPLVRLSAIEKAFNLKARLYAKLEWYNLTGSAKDRPAFQMISDAEKAGLKKGGTIIEATSGNMGISLACVAKKLGYNAIIVMPDNMSKERISIIKAYGATLILTDKELGMKGAIDKVDEICKQDSSIVKMLQFSNKSNVKAHYLTTGPEILKEVDAHAFVAGIGTGGTISGVGKYLKENNRQAKVFGVEPSESPMIEKGYFAPHKIQGIGANFIPENLDVKILDGIIGCSYCDAKEMAQSLSKLEGLLVGVSSGASLYGAVLVAQKKELEGKNVVTLFTDSGIKYLSTDLFD